MNEAFKTLASIPLVVIAGGLSIVEIVLGVIYQLAKLIRQGFKLFTNVFLRICKEVYEPCRKATIKKENDKDEIEILTFDYEMEEES